MDISVSTSTYITVTLKDLYTEEPIVNSILPLVYLKKYNAQEYQVIIDNSNWFEIDSINMPGVYYLKLTISDTDSLGPLLVSVIDSTLGIGNSGMGSNRFIETYYVVPIQNNNGRFITNPQASITLNPGMNASIVLDLTDNFGVRVSTDTGTLPAITRVFVPSSTSPGFILDSINTFPIVMSSLDTGIYIGSYPIRRGSIALGVYLIDVSFVYGGTTIQKLYQVNVNLPFGTYSMLTV